MPQSYLPPKVFCRCTRFGVYILTAKEEYWQSLSTSESWGWGQEWLWTNNSQWPSEKRRLNSLRIRSTTGMKNSTWMISDVTMFFSVSDIAGDWCNSSVALLEQFSYACRLHYVDPQLLCHALRAQCQNFIPNVSPYWRLLTIEGRTLTVDTIMEVMSLIDSEISIIPQHGSVRSLQIYSAEAEEQAEVQQA